MGNGAGLLAVRGASAKIDAAALDVYSSGTFFWLGVLLGRALTSANCYQQINLLTELLSLCVH